VTSQKGRKKEQRYEGNGTGKEGKGTERYGQSEKGRKIKERGQRKRTQKMIQKLVLHCTVIKQVSVEVFQG
jgi:hypothetical protein